MDLAFNYKILVAEDFCLINYEIKMLLKRRGFNVIETSGQNDLLDVLKKGSPDFIITCVAGLKKIQGQENLLKTLSLLHTMESSTDTMVLDGNMNFLKRYPKPFNSNDIINYILETLKIEIQPDNN